VADIAAVVVSYFSQSTLDACLSRLLASVGVARVVVVDNDSRDNSVAIVNAYAARDPRVQVIANAHNPGFAVACNQGAALCSEPWLALVNPDCLLATSDLEELRELAQAQPDAGIVGADLVDDAGVRDNATRRHELTLARLLAGFGQRDSLAIAADDSKALQAVDAVSGALMLMPRSVFNAVGGFDGGYRLHAEDLDLCRRVRDAGHGVYVANRVRVLHLRGVSSRRRPLWVEWQKHRGIWRYLRRFDRQLRNPLWWALAGVLLWAHLPLAMLHAMLRRKPPHS
jgi:hypothetical protein